MATLSGSVGQGGVNGRPDVLLVQQRLIHHAAWLGSPPAATGTVDDATISAITLFQRTACALLRPDGLVSPGGFTIAQLVRIAIPKPAHPIFTAPPRTRADSLGASDYSAAATKLGCQAAAIEAVAQVETRSAPWDRAGRPVILFERHLFSRLTQRRFDATHPDISNPVQGGYGLFADQYPKLYRAAVLMEEASLEAASWGQFQQVALYHAELGYPAVAAFVDAMMAGVARHLDIFVASIRSDARRQTALRGLDWAAFAAAYNGPDYGDYDQRMAAAYAAIVSAESGAVIA